ncbi:hypothetical protein [Paenibacillus kobensis]|uniref:hypothetical protein n=1 Tax=Paenibacillus kobensis TaxID=59841 RepID=UPI000FDBFFF4|nr:hypothetical protein [Paenibacillus kobensis]
MDINLGKVDKNSFKESNAVNIAKRAVEKNNMIKSYFSEMDKRANLDGQLTILVNEFERVTVDVQIKGLPKNFGDDNNYFYDCDTKVFNVVKEKVTQNAVVLFLVDTINELVYYKLLTREYVLSFNIRSEVKKRVKFSDKDIFVVEPFIKNVFGYIKLLNSEVSLSVECLTIQHILEEEKNTYVEEYKQVYKRGDITGYLTAFLNKTPVGEATEVYLIKMEDGKRKEKMQIRVKEGYLCVNRSIQRTEATDSDVCNILYEVVLVLKRPLLFESAGVPTFLVKENGDIWDLHAERVSKVW